MHNSDVDLEKGAPVNFIYLLQNWYGYSQCRVRWNDMPVLGKCSREMSAIHLIKTYCLPTMLYGCEVWILSDSSSHRISVAWNNCLRRVFGCCWRQNVRPLQHFC